MKKIIRTLTIAVIALVATLTCAFAVACNSGKDSDTSSDYNFTIVYEDGTAVNGQKDGLAATGGKVTTQICIDTNCLPLSLQNIYPDENGKLSLSQKQVNDIFGLAITVNEDITKFVFHVVNVPGHKDDCEVTVNGKGDYKVTVTNN